MRHVGAFVSFVAMPLPLAPGAVRAQSGSGVYQF